ncbi:hypothetical protein GJAV_G00140800 [Gymnothorax javanicus]|nr:hypothetical protein GJAV_G00140800 [Gymnothorax javanicus]
MLLTVSVESLSCLTMKSFTAASGWSVCCSGIPVKIRLSLMLRDCYRVIIYNKLTFLIASVRWTLLGVSCLSGASELLELLQRSRRMGCWELSRPELADRSGPPRNCRRRREWR